MGSASPTTSNRPATIRRRSTSRGFICLARAKLAFLDTWSEDWTGVKMKAVLSQTAFCGAVHLHGSTENRLLADLDCNGWPQTGRNKALAALRRVQACHLCGDQHLSVVVKTRDQGVSATVPMRSPIRQSSTATTVAGGGRPTRRAGGNPIAGSPFAVDGRFSRRPV